VLKRDLSEKFSTWADGKDRLTTSRRRKLAGTGIGRYGHRSREKPKGGTFAFYRWGPKTNDKGGVEMKYQSITPWACANGVDRRFLRMREGQRAPEVGSGRLHRKQGSDLRPDRASSDRNDSPGVDRMHGSL